MIKHTLLTLLLVLTGCTRESISYEHRCTTPEQRERLAKFVVDCATAANPKSDEEGEDLVAECRHSGLIVLCPRQEVRRVAHGWSENWREVKP